MRIGGKRAYIYTSEIFHSEGQVAWHEILIKSKDFGVTQTWILILALILRRCDFRPWPKLYKPHFPRLTGADTIYCIGLLWKMQWVTAPTTTNNRKLPLFFSCMSNSDGTHGSGTDKGTGERGRRFLLMKIQLVLQTLNGNTTLQWINR